MAWQRNFSDGDLIILDENNVLQSYWNIEISYRNLSLKNNRNYCAFQISEAERCFCFAREHQINSLQALVPFASRAVKS